jgi:hypothetical protein
MKFGSDEFVIELLSGLEMTSVRVKSSNSILTRISASGDRFSFTAKVAEWAISTPGREEARLN